MKMLAPVIKFFKNFYELSKGHRTAYIRGVLHAKELIVVDSKELSIKDALSCLRQFLAI